MNDRQDETLDQRIPDIDEPVGDYVHEAPYLEMRLRMLLTGTAGPSEEAWAKGLSRLLEHLERHPVREEDALRSEDSPVTGHDAPSAPINGDAFAADLADEIRMLDLDDDLIPLVMGSDTPMVARMTGRVLDWTEVHHDSFVDLVRREDGTRDFCIDVALHFEDPKGPATLGITLFGTDRKGAIEWSSADLSTRDTPADVRDAMIDGIVSTLGGMGPYELHTIADSDLIDLVEPDRPIIVDVKRDRIVLTGMEDLRAFIAGGVVIVNGRAGAVTIPCLMHGTIEHDVAIVTAMSLGL